MSVSKRVIKRQLVLESLIRKYSIEETRQYAESLHIKISQRLILDLRKKTKDEARQYFFTLAKDDDAYLLQFMIRIKSYEKLLKTHWQDFDNTNDQYLKIKISREIQAIEKQLDEWYRLLPYGQGSGYDVLSLSEDKQDESESNTEDKPGPGLPPVR